MVNLDDVFLKIGFAEKPNYMGGRVFFLELKGMQIEAIEVNLIHGPVYAIHLYKDGRALQMESSYIPATADSFEQGLALVVFGIGLREEQNFGTIPDWYLLGKEYKSFLPWEIDRERNRKAFEALPKVHMDIEWMRVMVKMLKSWKGECNSAEISFLFDGSFLRFECGGKQLPFPATGKPWEAKYFLDSNFLDRLPKRIHKRNVVFRVEENQLNFANTLYQLIEAKPI